MLIAAQPYSGCNTSILSEQLQAAAAQVMEIDTLGTFNMCRASFEALKASQVGGVVTLGR